MRVFVTGATGFVGSAVVQDLLTAGQRVLGLARADADADALTAAGAEVHRGDLSDLDGLRRGVAAVDAVVHTAFHHDFAKFVETSERDRLAIEALGAALDGSDRPFVVTAGLRRTPGRVTTEDDAAPPRGAGGTPRVSEQAALALAVRGVRTAVVRMAQVHDRDRQGFATYLVAVAREKGVSAYVGDGANRWPTVHRLDTAPLYRLALERAAGDPGAAGATYHAVTEEGVPVRAVAEAIGRGLGLPVVAPSSDQAAGHFGWLASIAAMDIPASSARTRQHLGRRPAGRPTFLADLGESSVFDGAPAGGAA